VREIEGGNRGGFEKIGDIVIGGQYREEKWELKTRRKKKKRRTNERD